MEIRTVGLIFVFIGTVLLTYTTQTPIYALAFFWGSLITDIVFCLTMKDLNPYDPKQSSFGICAILVTLTLSVWACYHLAKALLRG